MRICDVRGWMRGAFVVTGILILAAHAGCAMSLLNASAAGDTKKVMLLLQEGHQADEAFPIVGTRPLMLAAAYGHTETLQALLDAGANANAEDLTGWTALHAGAYRGEAAIVSLLLKHGASFSRPRWFLASPLQIADMLDHKEVIPLLREAQNAN